MEESLTPEDLPKIEKEMKRIIDENLAIVDLKFLVKKRRKIFAEIGDNLKLELIDDIPEGETIYYLQTR